LAAVLARASVPVRTLAALTLAAWAAVLAVRTDRRVLAWQDDRSLWSSALETAPSSARVHHNLAATLAEDGHFGRARRHLERAMRLDRAYWPSMLGFAGIHCERRRFAAAEARIAEARAHGATASQADAVERRCAELRAHR
jgi:Flp pilus assembly protein TadD